MQRWGTASIGDLCDIIGGGTPSTAIESYWKGTIPWISPKDVKSEIVCDSADHISPLGVQNSATAMIPKDSVLVVVRSGILARTIPIALTGRELAINQDIKALRPNERILPRFLYRFLQAREGDLLTKVSRGATVHRLATEAVRSLAMPVPPVSEQQRIVRVLDKAFTAIAAAKDNTEKNLQNARGLPQSHVESILVERRDWAQKRLGQLCRIKTGKKDVNEGSPDGKYPFFTCAAKHTYSNSYSFDTEALLVAGNGNVGQVSYYSGKFEAYQRTYVLSNFNEILPKYLFHILNARLSRAVSSQKLGNTMPYIKLGMLTEFRVPVPPPSEQKRIVDQFDHLAEETKHLLSRLQEKLNALVELESCLLHQAFNCCCE